MGSRREDVAKLTFSGANLLACVEKHHSREGWQHCDAHVFTQASEFWLLLCPSERHEHSKAENNFLSQPGNQAIGFGENHNLQADTVGEKDKKW